MVELEILAKKFDRFGWDRDSGSAAQDGLIVDWMEALQDYPLDEVRAACRQAIMDNPNKMPNEGHVKAQIIKARSAMIASQPRAAEPNIEPHKPTAEEKQRMADLLAEVGFTPKKMNEAPS